MDISSTSISSSPRTVSPTKSSSDKQSNEKSQSETAELKANERAQQQQATQERLQEYKEENQRRLDGRIISFGHKAEDASTPQNQSSVNRSRVNEAYSPPAQNELTNSHKEHNQGSNEQKRDAIDIVV